MPASTDGRTAVVDALTAAGIPCYGYTPGTVVPPVVLVEPGDPWMTVNRLGPELHAQLQLDAAAVVQLVDPELAVEQLEQLVEDVIGALPAGVSVLEVSQPIVENTGAQGSQLRSTLTLTAQVKE